ncbi:hypothetical protein ACE6H2_028739 [Prunus campanulata]
MEATDMDVEEQPQPNPNSFKRFGLKNSIQTNFGDDYVFQIVPKIELLTLIIKHTKRTIRHFNCVAQLALPTLR